MMDIRQIFSLAVDLGIGADPRGRAGVKEYLTRVKKDYEELKPKDKSYFNLELLANPYPDSHIHCGNEKQVVHRVLAGIDIGASEIIVASQLGERGRAVDLVIAHHQVGYGLASLHAVMDLQIEMFTQAGLPIHVAEKIMEERIKEVGRSVHPVNHDRVVDIARLLKVNFMNAHTLTDNLVNDFLHKFLHKRQPKTVGDLVDVLLEIPEYQEARKRGAGPTIIAGSPRSCLGRYLVEMTGGTNPSDKIYKELSAHGVSTIIGMHMKDGARDRANEHFLNVVIAGHMASDSLGMNLFLDVLEKRGIEVLPCSGLIRIKRE